TLSGAPLGWLRPMPRLSNVRQRYRSQCVHLRTPAVAMHADALNEEHGRAIATHVVGKPTAAMLSGKCFVDCLCFHEVSKLESIWSHAAQKIAAAGLPVGEFGRTQRRPDR